jgi:tetratricopeptide (TPR) repeat protein
MSSASRKLGGSEQAMEWMERAIGLYRTEQDVRFPRPMTDSVARAEGDYALQLMQAGRWMQAERMIHSALDHFTQAGVEAGRTHAVLSMGELQMRRGDLEAAMDWTGQAVELALSGLNELGKVVGRGGHEPPTSAVEDAEQSPRINDQGGSRTMADIQGVCDERFEEVRRAL